MFRRTSHNPVAEQAMAEAHADVIAVTDVVTKLGRATTVEEAVKTSLESVRQHFGWAYGSYWERDRIAEVLRFGMDSGDVSPEFRTVTLQASFAEGVGLSGRTWRQRDLVFVEDLGTMVDCVRAPVATKNGVRSGICFPILEQGEVIGTMDFFTTEVLTLSADRLAVLRAIGVLVSSALERLHETVRQEKAAQDVDAVSAVIRELTSAGSEDDALRVAMEIIRRDFDWQYGSFWRLDEEAQVLRFSKESGDVNPEFRDVTLSASFAKGVGLSGRAWARNDFVFVEDLGELTDCVRRPAAQRAGVKSGVCLPITVNGKLVGTIDFFATRTLVMAKSREMALRNTAFLIGQAMERFQARQQLKVAGARLMESIGEVERNVTSASDVASRGGRLSQEANTQVAALGQASAEINKVVKDIQTIAAQTKLLALNATIEAARAGQSGKGFAVVAEEVKQLSSQTEQATTNVSDRVTAIQSRVEAVTASLADIHHAVDEINQTQQLIQGVLGDQMSVTRAILD
ncbi:GAF domain-containing protein [Kineosporia sp. NBRC 101731]|uniref:GAF domain-containing protein n=1 Tax=Kineosporia sp. NBRC 101731 TaxID=3032199 RepID=UPI00255221E8|nr:GAF domain-containing protein [Kineosporia sp. NBRC 101731]